MIKIFDKLLFESPEIIQNFSVVAVGCQKNFGKNF